MRIYGLLESFVECMEVVDIVNLQVLEVTRKEEKMVILRLAKWLLCRRVQ